MSLIPSLSDIPDLAPVEPGEYTLNVTKVFGDKKSKNTGRSAIGLIIDIDGEDNAKPVFHDLWLPMDSDEDSKKETMWRMIKEFCTAVGLDTDDGLEAEDFEDLSFDAILKLTEEEGYPPKNEIQKVL